jgi:hypothetical protein
MKCLALIGIVVSKTRFAKIRDADSGAAYVRSADEEVYFHDNKLEGQWIFPVSSLWA